MMRYISEIVEEEEVGEDESPKKMKEGENEKVDKVKELNK